MHCPDTETLRKTARKNGIKQIIYLSGIIPDHIPQEQLSRHLRSRLEVERVLGSYGVPVTTVRAGLIVGPQGSSFPILAKLVRRLPVMVLPKWTRTQTHPIALSDVLLALKNSIGNTVLNGRAIDVGGPDSMSRWTAQQLLLSCLMKRASKTNAINTGPSLLHHAAHTAQAIYHS
ncbi:hypothetical protein [Paenibacillus sp. IHBB 3054]|uniref:hypothetical protein n=1 Tax=Paenibacillus sp. IHBB 3054 TaxID=3425689 RepID=UPI003F67D68B